MAEITVSLGGRHTRTALSALLLLLSGSKSNILFRLANQDLNALLKVAGVPNPTRNNRRKIINFVDRNCRLGVDRFHSLEVLGVRAHDARRYISAFALLYVIEYCAVNNLGTIYLLEELSASVREYISGDASSCGVSSTSRKTSRSPNTFSSLMLDSPPVVPGPRPTPLLKYQKRGLPFPIATTKHKTNNKSSGLLLHKPEELAKLSRQELEEQYPHISRKGGREDPPTTLQLSPVKAWIMFRADNLAAQISEKMICAKCKKPLRWVTGGKARLRRKQERAGPKMISLLGMNGFTCPLEFKCGCKTGNESVVLQPLTLANGGFLVNKEVAMAWVLASRHIGEIKKFATFLRLGTGDVPNLYSTQNDFAMEVKKLSEEELLLELAYANTQSQG